MNKRFIGAALVVAVALGVLLFSALNSTAKSVVTVQALLAEKNDLTEIRLGARVAESAIEYSTTPLFLLRFKVHDIKHPGGEIPVLYHGIMPDTLKVGRDVILEGDFKSGEFKATSLLTQCPSKYEVPDGPISSSQKPYPEVAGTLTPGMQGSNALAPIPQSPPATPGY